MSALKINQKKVIETKALLLEIINQPSTFKNVEDLNLALRSQGGLAKYSNVERNIASCSLNTLKSASESFLHRGFVELDELRINAKDAIEGAVACEKTTKSTRAGLRCKVELLENQLSTMQKSNFLLTIIISELRDELKKMALSTNSIESKQAEYQRINRKIEVELSYTFDGEV